MDEIKSLVNISKYAGERFDLVQAGGGNSSVKLDNGEMIIKASGFLLSDVKQDSGYSRVFTKQIADILQNNKILNSNDKRHRESLTTKLVQSATIDKNNRPSIETLLHSSLLKYTLHTHPIVVNMIVIQKNAKVILQSIFPDMQIVFVEYQTPGIELALKLDNELKKLENIPNIIFLQNHGLIVTSSNEDDIYKLNEYVLDKIEKYLKINISRYKTTNKITSLLNNIELNDNISYLSEDEFLNRQLKENKDLFFQTPFCPDSLVYCGISCVEINDISDTKSINSYKNKYYELPKVIILDGNLFFIAANIKKTKEMEDVFKFHIMVLSQNNTNINSLQYDELAYLSNWEAEQYRQKL